MCIKACITYTVNYWLDIQVFFHSIYFLGDISTKNFYHKHQIYVKVSNSYRLFYMGSAPLYNSKFSYRLFLHLKLSKYIHALKLLQEKDL